MYKVLSKEKYQPRAVDFSKQVRQGVTLPDQSLSIREILNRFVKGIPVDVVKREAVYLDDRNTVDMEKLARADFAEKIETARQYGEQAEQMEAMLTRTNTEDEEPETRTRGKSKDSGRTKVKPAKGAVVDDLDNTTTDDTGPDNQ